MNDREAAESEITPIRDAILHGLQQVPSAAGLSDVEPGGTAETNTILATCLDGTEIAIEIMVL